MFKAVNEVDLVTSTAQNYYSLLPSNYTVIYFLFLYTRKDDYKAITKFFIELVE